MKMETRAPTFGQYLKSIHGVALRCAHKKSHNKLKKVRSIEVISCMLSNLTPDQSLFEVKNVAGLLVS